MCTFQKSCVDISDKIKTFAIFFSSKHLSGSPDPTTNSETINSRFLPIASDEKVIANEQIEACKVLANNFFSLQFN